MSDLTILALVALLFLLTRGFLRVVERRGGPR